MSALIVYSSRYGSTRQYAQWISEDLSIPAVAFKQVGERDLVRASLVILGSSVMMESLTLGKWIRSRWPILGGKRLILFSVSATLPNNEPGLRAILERSLMPAMTQRVHYVPLHGRIILADLPVLYRPLVKAVMMSREGPECGTSSTGEFDGVRRENIEPIVEAARRLELGSPIRASSSRSA